jgi:hypothetical protein
MAILNKAEFEKEIKDAIENGTKLYAEVEAMYQYIPGDKPTTVTLHVRIPINGWIRELPETES